MRLLFVHDHKFRYIEGTFYSTGGLNDEILSRYTNLFDEVIVLSRVIEERNISIKYSKINNPKVKFVNSKTIKNKEILELIRCADKVIVRLPCFNGIKVLPKCRRLGINYLIEMVACPWDSLWNYDFRGKIIAPFIYLFNKQEIKKAPNVLYVTKYFLQKRYPNKNGNIIDCSDVSLENTTEDIIKNNFQKNKIITIGTLAAVDVKYKGQLRVIKALALLKKKGFNNYRYYLAGNGNKEFLLRKATQLGVENQVFFDGGIPHEQIATWFDKIDIYIQPSLQEGLPRSLLEAMNYGLPCLGATTGGIPELLDSKYLFKNSYSCHKQIAILLESLDKQSLIDNSRRNFTVAKEYSNDVLEQKRNKFYKDFCLQKKWINKSK